MILLLSGEGRSDIGQSLRGGDCRGDEFQPGPMALLVEQLLELCLGYKVFENARLHDPDGIRFLDETTLGQLADEVKSQREMLLPSKESPLGTIYFRKSAYALGQYARRIELQESEGVTAVLFRDSDKTRSNPRDVWQRHRDSMEKGFLAAEFSGGVVMIPRPKSEVWLLCALKHKYQYCDALEEQSGNDNSPNNLKNQLSEHLKGNDSSEQLNELIEAGQIVAREIKMPSFVAFLVSLARAAQHNGLDVSELI